MVPFSNQTTEPMIGSLVWDDTVALNEEKAMSTLGYWSAFAVCVLVCVGAVATEPVVMPLKGQTEAQRTNDMARARSFSMQQTGVNPEDAAFQLEWVYGGAAAKRQVAATPSYTRSVAGGALRGATYGLIASEVDNPIAVGAGLGAVEGALVNSSHKRTASAAASPKAISARNEEKALRDGLARYQRVYQSMLEGMGYRVVW